MRDYCKGYSSGSKFSFSATMFFGCGALTALCSVTGGELFARLIKDDSFTESEAAYYLRQLLLAVEFMHAKNIIHLDIKVQHSKLSLP